MIYVSDAVAIHLSNAYWYLDIGDMLNVETSAEDLTAMNNKGFVLRWNRISASREIQLIRPIT